MAVYIDADSKTSDIMEAHFEGFGKVIFVLKGKLPIKPPGPTEPPPVVKECVVQGFSPSVV